MEDSSLSAYELSRLQRIKENQELVRDKRFEIAVHCVYLSSASTAVSRGNETLRLSTFNCQLLFKSVWWAWFYYYYLLLLLLLGKYTYRIISKKEIQFL